MQQSFLFLNSTFDFSAINMKLKNKIHPNEMCLSAVSLYCIEKDVHIPLNKGHFIIKQLHLKENSSNPSSNPGIWIQRQLLTLDHCRGTCLQGVEIFEFFFSLLGYSHNLRHIFLTAFTLCCLTVALSSVLYSANPGFWHYWFLFMDHKT